MIWRRRLLRPALGPRFQGIRFRLGAAMALALLPFLLLSAVQLQADFRDQAHARRGNLALAAERSVAGQMAHVEATAALLQVLGLESTARGCGARLDALVGRLETYRALGRYGVDGQLACGSRLAPAEAAGWMAALRSGRPVVAEPLGEAADHLIIAARLQRPLGAFDGAAAAILPLADLLPRSDARGLPAGTETALVTPEGRLLAASDPRAFADVAALTAPPAASGRAMVTERRDAAGHSRVQARATLIDGQVQVLFSAPAPSLWSWARLNPLGGFLLPVAVWLTVFVAVMLLSERFVIRWLDYLQRVAAIHARGRLSVRPIKATAAPTEIRALARTLDDLAEGVTVRDRSLQHALEEKDALMREIHHRVKNNLQIISSLLSLQQRALKDPAARMALGDTRRRISALALIYRTLYQAEDLGRADMKDFLTALVGQMVAEEAGRGQVVESRVEADSLIVDPDKLAPLALWLVEAVSNAQKHALGTPGGGRLSVRFRVDGASSVLEVEDDGPGLDPGAAGGVGRTLMSAFARQLRGETEALAGPGGGTLMRMTFVTPIERPDRSPGNRDGGTAFD